MFAWAGAATAHDVLAWWALGGLALWGVPLGRRLCPDLPEAVWPLATLGLMGLGSRALVPLAGGGCAPETLEHFSGHAVVGPCLMVLGLGGWVQSVAASGRVRRPLPLRRSGAGVLVALLPVAVGGPWAMMPPWALDESLYHLSFSLHGILAGHTWAPPGHGNGGFFALGDHIAQLGLWMGSVPAARGTQLWSVVWCGHALWALAPQLSARQALAAQALFVSSPVVLWQLGTAYVDITQSAFELGAVALWAHGARARAARAWPFAAWALCGWLCGCAAACKVLALVWLPCWGWALLRHRGRAAGGGARPWPRAWPILLGGVACLPWAPDVLHNVLRYHAPLFPFGGPLWPGGEGLTAGQRDALHAFLALHGPRWDGLPLTGGWRFAALPWALLFAADFASPRFDGVLGAVPLMWLCLWAACLRHPAVSAPLAAGAAPPGRPEAPDDTGPLLRALHGFVLVRLAVWLSTSLQARFLVGPLWALCWATAARWPTALGTVPAPARRPVRALALAAGLVCVGSFAQSLTGHMPPLQLSVWGQDRAARQGARLRAVPASALCDAVPRRPGHRVMLVWAQRLSLFCMAEQHADSYDEAATLKAILTAGGGQPERAAALLRALGISHIIVHEGRAEADMPPPLWQRFVALRGHLLQPQAAVGPFKLYMLAPVGPHSAAP